MNNAQVLVKEEKVEQSVHIRHRIEELTKIIDALNHVAGSNYWKLLKQYVFDVDLEKAKNRLEREENEKEIYRLQGYIKYGNKFSLEALHKKYRDELLAIRGKINE